MANALQSFLRRAQYTIDRTFKTGNRRAEFEHKYETHGDYFHYQGNPYELEKYKRTLDLVLKWRRGSASALEIGCSVGLFTAMIAREFETVTAVDIASEALALAEKQVAGAGRVSYVRSNVEALNLGRQFDVIFCAEVLMYVRERDAQRVCEMLDSHLGLNGIVIEVSQQDREDGKPKFFHGWDRVLGGYFERIHFETFADPTRPYEISAFARRRTA